MPFFPRGWPCVFLFLARFAPLVYFVTVARLAAYVVRPGRPWHRVFPFSFSLFICIVRRTYNERGYYGITGLQGECDEFTKSGPWGLATPVIPIAHISRWQSCALFSPTPLHNACYWPAAGARLVWNFFTPQPIPATGTAPLGQTLELCVLLEGWQAGGLEKSFLKLPCFRVC